MTADILREKFLDFFAAKSHKIIPSDSLVPADDPTVLFTSAGMNQFKKQFLGQVTDFRRAASCQKCLRTDDLDKVGKTCGHHTFFEMLGNFSFGDYFKAEAISFAWEFMTQVLGLPEERLWVSVYKDDIESYKIWHRIKISKQKIIKLGDKENFWPSDAKKLGPNGPCGPCSEIFYDYGKTTGCKKKACTPACSCGRFVEVWNLVFTQFLRKDKGVLEGLPAKNIDTGMGLERLAAVMQGAKSNFETELFTPLIDSLKSMLKNKVSIKDSFYLKTIADHSRAITFAICDGVVPSNEERGYVVRKLIRLCSGYGRHLDLNKPFLYKLTPVVARIMQRPYPELQERRENISQIILAEEEKFIDVFKRAPLLIEEKFSKTIPHSGKVAFELYDTYGIPLEEIARLVKEKYRRNINKKEFQDCISKQKERSRKVSKISGDIFVKPYAASGIGTEFIYGQSEVKAKVQAIFINQKQKNEARQGELIEVVLDKTVFYAQSGGQISDTGTLKSDKLTVEINDVKRTDNLTLHSGKVVQGELKAGDEVVVAIDYQRRMDIAKNHTATHLLQVALRKILGPHVRQQGSLVASDRLRFDFAHFKDISASELKRIEDTVNEFIKNADPLTVKSMSISEARKRGALAFFAEKYQDTVRVVSVGNYSQELCGGTHLENTKDVGLFKITSESSVAAGIRRIEAVTGRFAQEKIAEDAASIEEISKALEVAPQRIEENVKQITTQLKYLAERLKSFRLGLFNEDLNNLINTAGVLSGTKVIIKKIEHADLELLREMADRLRQKMSLFVIILASIYEDKVYFITAISADLIKNNGLDASRLIREIAGYAGGTGGGRKDFAQAGAKDISRLDAALCRAREIIERELK